MLTEVSYNNSSAAVTSLKPVFSFSLEVFPKTRKNKASLYKLAKIKAQICTDVFKTESIQLCSGVNGGGATAERPHPRRKRVPRRSSSPARAAARGPPPSLQNLQEEQNRTSTFDRRSTAWPPSWKTPVNFTGGVDNSPHCLLCFKNAYLVISAWRDEDSSLPPASSWRPSHLHSHRLPPAGCFVSEPLLPVSNQTWAPLMQTGGCCVNTNPHQTWKDTPPFGDAGPNEASDRRSDSFPAVTDQARFQTDREGNQNLLEMLLIFQEEPEPSHLSSSAGVRLRQSPVSLPSPPSPSSPCRFLMWTFLLPDCEKVFPQIPHRWGFSPGGGTQRAKQTWGSVAVQVWARCHLPECTSMCFLRLEYSAKDRPHPSVSHRNGFSPAETPEKQSLLSIKLVFIYRQTTIRLRKLTNFVGCFQWSKNNTINIVFIQNMLQRFKRIFKFFWSTYSQSPKIFNVQKCATFISFYSHKKATGNFLDFCEFLRVFLYINQKNVESPINNKRDGRQMTRKTILFTGRKRKHWR